MRRGALLVLPALALAITVSACQEAAPEPATTSPPTDTPEPTPTAARVEAQVVKVIDGDTIKVSVGGQVHSLRYIGIDCPETVHPSEPVKWMGLEASQANRQLLEGQTRSTWRRMSRRRIGTAACCATCFWPAGPS